ncbi:hypothetical protein BH24CHL4_BH24CHL4_26970 [soil metagenome]
MGILAGEAVSGAAMNPARWFGPAVIQQETTDFLVWIIGPLVGGVAAALLYNAFLLRGHSEQEDKAIICFLAGQKAQKTLRMLSCSVTRIA